MKNNEGYHGICIACENVGQVLQAANLLAAILNSIKSGVDFSGVLGYCSQDYDEEKRFVQFNYDTWQSVLNNHDNKSVICAYKRPFGHAEKTISLEHAKWIVTKLLGLDVPKVDLRMTSIKISDTYTAIINKDCIKVGCQTITPEVFDKIAEAFNQHRKA
jgi:hypothetical protein